MLDWNNKAIGLSRMVGSISLIIISKIVLLYCLYLVLEIRDNISIFKDPITVASLTNNNSIAF